MALQTYLAHIRTHIQKDELSAALKKLHDLLENSPKLNEVIQQMGRFEDLRQQMRLGRLTHENAVVDKNQLRWALLELVTEIEKEGVKPELAGELENAVSIVQSKNVISRSNLDAGRDIHIGDKIIHYGERKIPHLLTDPPFIPELFLGRTDDLQRIHDSLFAPNGHLLLLVNGVGGVGKTSIASTYFHTYQEKYAHVAWVFSEKNIASALLQLAIPLGLQFDERADTLERLRGLIQALFELKKPCLLIIDNANELNELQTYLPHLQRCSNFHLLFTTRINEYPQVNVYKIEPLPQYLALQAFKSHYPAFDAKEEPIFFEIYTAVQGNTLLLELLAKNLKNFNNKLKKNYQLADLRRELEQGLLQLSKTSAVDVRYQAQGTGLRNEKIEVIIAAMYDLGDLDAAEIQVLSVFAVLPAESIPFERLETLLPELEALDTTLLSLAQKGWLEYNEEGAAFKCSPVVQEVVRMKQVDLLENCIPMIDALCKQLDSEILHLDNYQHSALFVRYGEAVLSSFTIADDDLGTLCQNIGNYYTDTGDLNKALATYQKMRFIQAELFEGQPEDAGFKNGLAISYNFLGNTHSSLGNLNQALTFFEDYNNLEKELYAAYPHNVEFKNNLAISYAKLGETHSDLGNLQQALTFFEDYNNLEKELYAAYPQNVSFKNGLAISYAKLGETHSALGNLQQALTFFEKDIELSKELYPAYPQNVSFKNGLAISYEKLGQTHSALGNLQQALTFFEDETKLFEELYAAYPQNVSFKNGLAVSYSKLGVLYRDKLGDLQKPKEYFQHCYALWKELSEAYPAYVEFRKNFEWAKGAMNEE